MGHHPTTNPTHQSGGSCGEAECFRGKAWEGIFCLSPQVEYETLRRLPQHPESEPLDLLFALGGPNFGVAHGWLVCHPQPTMGFGGGDFELWRSALVKRKQDVSHGRWPPGILAPLQGGGEVEVPNPFYLVFPKSEK